MEECVLHSMVTLRSNTRAVWNVAYFFGIGKGVAHEKLFPTLLIQALVTTTAPIHLLL